MQMCLCSKAVLRSEKSLRSLPPSGRMEFWLQFIQTGKLFTKWIGFDREVTFGLKKKNEIKNLLGISVRSLPMVLLKTTGEAEGSDQQHRERAD